MKNILFKIFIVISIFFGGSAFVLSGIWWSGNQRVVLNLFLLAKGSSWHMVQGDASFNLHHKSLSLAMKDVLLVQKGTHNIISVAKYNLSYHILEHFYDVDVKNVGVQVYRSPCGLGWLKMLQNFSSSRLKTSFFAWHRISVDGGQVRFFAFKDYKKIEKDGDMSLVRYRDFPVKSLISVGKIHFMMTRNKEGETTKATALYNDAYGTQKNISIISYKKNTSLYSSQKKIKRSLLKIENIPLSIITYFRSKESNQILHLKQHKDAFLNATADQDGALIHFKGGIHKLSFSAVYNIQKDKGTFQVKAPDTYYISSIFCDDLKDRITFPWSMTGTFSWRHFHVTGRALFQKGVVLLEPYFPRLFKVRGGDISFEMGDLGKTVIQSHINLLDHTSITQYASFRYRMGDRLRRVLLRVAINSVPLDDLGRVWPKGLASDSRTWVTGNMRHGSVQNVTLFYQTDGEGRLLHFGGEMHVKSAVVDYNHPLPKAQNVFADITYNTKGLKIHVTKGNVYNLSLSSFLDIIYHPIGGDFTMAIKLTPHGDIQDLLKVLNHKPLYLIQDLGVGKDFIPNVKGNVDGSIALSFPLKETLTPDQIQVYGDGTVKNVVVKHSNKFFRSPLMNVKVNRERMMISSKGSIDKQYPFDFIWHEYFKGQSGLQRRVVSTLSIPRSQLAPWIKTKASLIPLNMDIKKMHNGHATINLSSNLSPYSLSVPLLGYAKKIKDPLRFSAYIEESSRGYNIHDIGLEGKGVRVSGSGFVDQNNVIKNLIFNHAIFPHNDISFSIVNDHGRYKVVARVQKLFIQYLTDLFPDKKALVKPSSAQSPVKVSLWDRMSKNISLDASVAKLDSYQKEAYQNAKISWKTTHNSNDFLHFTVDDPEGREAMHIHYQPEKENFRSLDVSVLSLGKLLKNIGIAKEVNGGKLLVEGTQKDKNAPLMGKLSLKSYSPVNIPILVNLLKVVSITGILDAFNSRLFFDALYANYQYKDHVLSIRKGYTYGLSTGMTVEGTIDFLKNKINLRGGIVPAFFLNRAIASVPLFGKLLTGGDQEGLLTANYSIQGSIDNPQIMVNPFTMLLPGVVRDFFSNLFS